MGTKNEPGEFDCYAAAASDEPMFILLGRDPLAGPLVRIWVLARSVFQTGPDEEKKLKEALETSARLSEYALQKRGKARVQLAVAALASVLSHAKNMFRQEV